MASNHNLYLVTGQPGVGKTTWGKALAQRQQAVFLDIDTVTQDVVQAGLSCAQHNPQDRDSEFFKQHFRLPIYASLFATAQSNLTHLPVVITGPFTTELSNPSWHDELTDKFNCPITIFWLHATPDKILQRVQQRGASRDNDKLDNWERYQDYFSQPPRCRHIKVDMN